MPGLDAAIDPIERAKERLRDEIGLEIGLDYQLLYQKSTSSMSDIDEGAAGHVRMIGKWTLFDRDGSNPGSFVFILENRHNLGTKVTPVSLAGELGYIGVTGTTFNDGGNSLSVAHWAQTIDDGRAGLVVGRIDPTDYTDILGYVNPRTTFLNLAVLYNPVLVLPDPGFGVGGGAYLTDQVYALGVVSDANGSLTDVKWFPGGAELYKKALPVTSELHISWVEENPTGDIHFPSLDLDDWKVLSISEYSGFNHIHYQRNNT